MPNPIINRRVVCSTATAIDSPNNDNRLCSYYFDGSTSQSRIDFGDNLDSFLTTGVFSIRFLMRRVGVGSIQEIIRKNTIGGSQRSLQVRFTAANTIEVQTSADGSTTATYTTTISFAGTVGWYDIVLVINKNEAANANRVKVYVNGTAIATTPSGTMSGIFNSTAPLLIGGSAGATQSLHGYVNQVTITSDIITSAEVTSLYAGGAFAFSNTILDNIILYPEFKFSTFDGLEWVIPDSWSGLTGVTVNMDSMSLDCGENPY